MRLLALAFLVLALSIRAATLGVGDKLYVGQMIPPAAASSGGFSSDGNWWTNVPYTLASNTVDHLVYNFVTAEDGKVWLDRNLGASEVATSKTDTAAYGYLYQWGRLSDGHQISTSGTTGTQSSGDVPGNGLFVIGSSDWRNPANDSLWQGVSGVNNPCPPGFRIPTDSEWTAIVSAAGITGDDTAFSSSLKLTIAGSRWGLNGNPFAVGANGYYWSSTTGSGQSDSLQFTSGAVSIGVSVVRSWGFSVRPIKN